MLCMTAATKTSAQLFCFHHAGGSSAFYTNWKRLLPPIVDIRPIGLPGRQERFHEPLITEFSAALEAVRSIVAPLVRAPFALIGHSMGALLAFELARKLEQLRLTPCALFVSACRAAHLWAEGHDKKSQLPDSALMQEIREMNGTPESVLLDTEMMQLILPIVRADFAVCDSYIFDPQPTLTCPIFAFGGLEDPDITREDIAAWGQLTSGGFRSRMLAGDHFFINQEWPARQICSAIFDSFAQGVPPTTTG
jgi:medium-chain acyl-[acyl-carrier-protein] hydrolase